MGCYLMSYNIVETKRENIFFFRIDNVINTIEAPTKDKTVVKTLQFTIQRQRLESTAHDHM